MAITNYSELQTAVASNLHRTDLTAEIKDFISLAEADLKVRAELTQWETSASVTITSGSGTLPSDFWQSMSVNYGSQTARLDYLPWQKFRDVDLENASGEPAFYTIQGDTLKVAPAATGTATLHYRARFASLSDSATTNSLLTLFPDVYLYGACYHASVWQRDMEGMQMYAAQFESAVGRVRAYTWRRRANETLQVRAS